MNLHGIAGPIVAAVNPKTPATMKFSAGSTVKPNGARVPAYSDAVSVMAQVQPMTTKDLRQVESLNLQGTQVGIYIDGESDGIIRSRSKGGDLVIIYTGVHAGVYLVAQVLEQWPDWVKVAATLQNDPIPAPPTSDPSLDFSDPDNSQYLPGL